MNKIEQYECIVWTRSFEREREKVYLHSIIYNLHPSLMYSVGYGWETGFLWNKGSCVKKLFIDWCLINRWSGIRQLLFADYKRVTKCFLSVKKLFIDWCLINRWNGIRQLLFADYKRVTKCFLSDTAIQRPIFNSFRVSSPQFKEWSSQ
jgi:hypothetical protein